MPQFSTGESLSTIANVTPTSTQDERVEENGMKMSTELSMPEKVALNTVAE